MLKLGAYNLVTDGYRWRHLIFYERDTPLTKEENSKVLTTMSKAHSAFIAYSTSSGGVHIMGLTPVSTVVWAYGFKDLDMDLHGNCSGHVLRVNRKPHELQTPLLAAGFRTYPMADQLYNLVIRKFGFSGEYYTGEGVTTEKWKSLFCLYGERLRTEYRPLPFK